MPSAIVMEVAMKYEYELEVAKSPAKRFATLTKSGIWIIGLLMATISMISVFSAYENMKNVSFRENS